MFYQRNATNMLHPGRTIWVINVSAVNTSSNKQSASKDKVCFRCTVGYTRSKERKNRGKYDLACQSGIILLRLGNNQTSDWFTHTHEVRAMQWEEVGKLFFASFSFLVLTIRTLKFSGKSVSLILAATFHNRKRMKYSETFIARHF